MMLSKYLPHLVRYLPLLVAAAVVALVLTRPAPNPTIYIGRPEPYIAPESTISTEWVPEVTREEIVAYKPTQRQIEAFEKEADTPIPQGVILGVSDIAPLPDGGMVVSTLVPTIEGDPTSPKELELTVIPNPPPRIANLLNDRAVSIWAGNMYKELRYEQGLLRVYRAEIRAEASYKLYTAPFYGGGKSDITYAIGIRIRF